MSRYLKFYLIGRDGYRWDLTDEREGVLLRPGPQKLFDAPARTFWLETSTGSHYQGMRFERRDPVFSVQIHGSKPDIWADRDSRFRMSLGMVGEDVFTLEAHTSYGIRRLKMRLLTDPIAYGSEDYEKHDPWLTHDSTLGISAACEQPFWEEDPLLLEWELPSGTSGTTTFAFTNPGDVPGWWKGFVTGGAGVHWQISDRSQGQKLYAKNTPPYNLAADHANRSVWLPVLAAGENVDIDTDPDWPTLIASNGAPVQARWQSNGFLYPLRPWLRAVDEESTWTVHVEGATAGAACTFEIPRRFSRPWGVSVA